MKSAQRLISRLGARFETLITEGEGILQNAKPIPAKYSSNDFTGQHFETQSAYKQLDWPAFVEWRTKTTTLLAQVVPQGHVHFSAVNSLPSLKPTDDRLEWGISMLKGVKNDLEEGFLDDIFVKIEAEIAADYMGQAERLLAEGHSGKFDHVPAAVLAGAVLEKGLRKLCTEQQPPVPVANPKGEPKTLNPLIDDLKKAGVFNELKAKQLRSWADVRNKAAHGEFDQFSKSDVEQMIHGITNFLADYLT